MSNFDEYIEKVQAYLKGKTIKEYDCPSSVDALYQGMPVQVGPGSNPGIILRSDTFAELGNPAEGSTGFILWTEDPSRVHDGRISLIGPDITELEGSSQPFGQVIMLGGQKLNPALQDKIEEYQHISDHLEGYMVRSSSRSIWGRISRKAAAKGFDLQTLGRALMIVMKSGIPEIESMEIVFVTSSKSDIQELDTIAETVESIRKDIIKEYWKEKGYDLECDLDCNSCNYRETCDDIKDILRTRNRMERAQSAEE